MKNQDNIRNEDNIKKEDDIKIAQHGLIWERAYLSFVCTIPRMEAARCLIMQNTKSMMTTLKITTRSKWRKNKKWGWHHYYIICHDIIYHDVVKVLASLAKYLFDHRTLIYKKGHNIWHHNSWHHDIWCYDIWL